MEAKLGFPICELLTPDDSQRNVIDKAGSDRKAFEHVNGCLAVRKKFYGSVKLCRCGIRGADVNNAARAACIAISIKATPNAVLIRVGSLRRRTLRSR